MGTSPSRRGALFLERRCLCDALQGFPCALSGFGLLCFTIRTLDELPSMRECISSFLLPFCKQQRNWNARSSRGILPTTRFYAASGWGFVTLNDGRSLGTPVNKSQTLVEHHTRFSHPYDHRCSSTGKFSPKGTGESEPTLRGGDRRSLMQWVRFIFLKNRP